MRLRQKIHAIWLGLALLLGIGIPGLLPVTASAQVKPVVAEIPVSVTGSNTEEAFSIRLELEESEFQAAEQNLLMLKAGQSDSFRIRYVVPGTYHMEVYQEAGKDKETTYDQTRYELDLYVTEDEEGNLVPEMVAYEKGSKEKLPALTFHNEKRPPESPKTPGIPSNTPKTGDTTDLAGYAALLCASALGLLLAVIMIRRKERR